VSAPQFFVSRLVAGERIALDPEDARHASGSLRLRAGDALRLADGDGAVGAGVVVEAGRATAVVEVGVVDRVERPTPVVSVALAPPKGDRLSWAVQKLAEVGVDDVILLDTERSVRRWDTARAAGAVDRLAGVAREAAMQSRRPFVMSVRGPASLADAVAAGGSVVVLWEHATEELAAALGTVAGDLRLVVGPEGGFSEAEVRACSERGAATASLGEGILRTETAALAASVVALHHLGRLG
jgi:16S rRNA (uracil1498-N3)-methyltransferase